MAVLNDCEFVVVNYCTPKLVLNCVLSILRLELAEAKNIIVVDNASPDNSLEALRALPSGVRLVQSDRNAGFGHGVNQGVAASTHDFVIVLNPDTYFTDPSVALAVELMRKERDIGLAGLDLIYPSGRRQYSSRRFYSIIDILGRRTPLGRYWPLKRRIHNHMMVDAWKQNTPFESEWAMGAGFIVRRDIFESIGRMDEEYFLYMEDVDICARVWRAGYRVVCVPKARLVHDHQRASAASPFSSAGKAHLRSLMRFRKKFVLPVFRGPGIAGIMKKDRTTI